MKKTVIILVNYNNHKDTIKCLNSISSAGYDNHVVVIDNYSTIPGVDKIKELFPKIKLIKNKENVGFGKANNLGIQWAFKNIACENVFILNNDTTIQENTIPQLERALEKDTKIAIATPKIVMMEDPKILWYGGGKIDWRKCSAIIPGYLNSSDTPESNQKRFVSFASGCAMLVRKEIILKLGGFDHRFFMYVEDVELCIKIIKNKYRILYVPEAVVYHKGQGSQRDTEQFLPIEHPQNPKLPFFLYHLTKNRLLTIQKHASFSESLKFWIYYPAFLLFKISQYLINRRFDGIQAIFKGIKDAITA